MREQNCNLQVRLENVSRCAAKYELSFSRVPEAAHYEKIRVDSRGAAEKNITDILPPALDGLETRIDTPSAEITADILARMSGWELFVVCDRHYNDFLCSDQERQRIVQCSNSRARRVPRNQSSSFREWANRGWDEDDWPATTKQDGFDEFLTRIAQWSFHLEDHEVAHLRMVYQYLTR